MLDNYKCTGADNIAVVCPVVRNIGEVGSGSSVCNVHLGALGPCWPLFAKLDQLLPFVASSCLVDAILFDYLLSYADIIDHINRIAGDHIAQ